MAGHLLATVGAERIWSSLRAAFFMFWETLWALGIGFALSGIVQAAISRDAVERRLGGKNPGSIARAAGYGRPPRAAPTRPRRLPSHSLRKAPTSRPP